MSLLFFTFLFFFIFADWNQFAIELQRFILNYLYLRELLLRYVFFLEIVEGCYSLWLIERFRYLTPVNMENRYENIWMKHDRPKATRDLIILLRFLLSEWYFELCQYSFPVSLIFNLIRFGKWIKQKW